MNNAMDPNFRYYDVDGIVDGITGVEQEGLSIMVAVPRVDLSDPLNRQEQLVKISGIVEEQYRRPVETFNSPIEYTGE
tara:strand:- start:706 stop:939 length:234 start_codon:yes stop_codon:yes gene_type:complete